MFEKKDGHVRIGKHSFNLKRFASAYPNKEAFVKAFKKNTFPRHLKPEDVYNKIASMAGVVNKKK